MVDSDPIFLIFALMIACCFFPQNCVLFLPSIYIQNIYFQKAPIYMTQENFYLGCIILYQVSYSAQEGSLLSSCRREGVSLRKLKKKMNAKWCILSLFFADCMLIFSPKLCVIFAFIAPISNVRDAGEFSP